MTENSSFIRNFLSRFQDRLSYGIFHPGRGSIIRPKQSKPYLAALMLLVTVVSTVFAGFQMFGSLRQGIIFSFVLIFILGAHELGHFFAAKFWSIPSSLPYFIPFPNIIGTMGAVIRLRAPIQNRKALFDIGVSGPIAGWILSLIALGIGYSQAQIMPVTETAGGVYLNFGSSLLIKILEWAIFGGIHYNIILNPFLFAGWVGMLVTALNLMPIGQLDGGHLFFSLFPKAQGMIAKSAFIILIGLCFLWWGWIVWVLLIFLFGTQHPDVFDLSELDDKRKKLGYFVIAILILTFIPVPITLN